MARKHASDRAEKSLRLSSCELEQYGVVIRVLGNGMFYVETETIPQLLGRIRSKFRGRSKRDNTITAGSVVLIGLREWEAPEYKECDLLEVYDANEVRQLMKNPSIDFSNLWKHMGGKMADSVEEAKASAEIEFSGETDDIEELLGEAEDSSESKVVESFMEDIVDEDDL